MVRAPRGATEAGDVYLQALALTYAGLASTEHGYPDDGLKMLWCAQVKSWDIPRDDQRAVVVGEIGRAAVKAGALEESAIALARMDDLAAAVTHLAMGRELWTPTRSDPFGDMDRPAARLELARGRLDAAEALATASMRRWEGGRQLSRTLTGTVLATIHVKAGERGGLQLAHEGNDGQGRVAINHLIVTEALPKRDGGHMLQGLWQMIQTNGPHPG
ncbi:MAG: hypothetical protein ACT4NY_12180 [Pseudonocardiales bacterium]